MKKILAIIFILSHFTLHVQKWSLEECIAYAIENNIEIKQTGLDIESAANTLNTSVNSRFPDISANISEGISFGRYQNVATGVYEENQASSTSFSVSASVPVFAGMRITNEIRTNRFYLKAAMEGFERAVQNLELQITSLYLEALFKKEILLIYRSQAELTRKQTERTEILAEAGKVPLSQLYEIKAQLAKDEMNVVTAGTDHDMALLNLAQALNFPDPHAFDIIEPETGDFDPENDPLPADPENIYQVAVSIKPHISEAEYYLEGSRSQLKVSKAAYWPTVSLGFSYNNGFSQILDSNIKNTVIGKQLKVNGREYLGLNVGIPIFSRFQNRNSVRSANIAVRNRELQLENTKLSLYKEIKLAHQSAMAAGLKFDASEKALLAAEESYRYADLRYETGKLTVVELMEVQNQLLSSRSERIQAIYEYIFRNKILKFYVGERITDL